MRGFYMTPDAWNRRTPEVKPEGASEVVAWRWCTHEHKSQWRDGQPSEKEKHSGSYKDWIEYAYSKPTPAPEQVEATASVGWKLVPVEPTSDMLDACGDIETYRNDFGNPFFMSWGEARDAYTAMLNAAPAAPQPTAEHSSVDRAASQTADSFGDFDKRYAEMVRDHPEELAAAHTEWDENFGIGYFDGKPAAKLAWINRRAAELAGARERK